MMAEPMTREELLEALRAIRADARKPLLARTATLVYRKGIEALIARLEAEPGQLTADEIAEDDAARMKAYEDDIMSDLLR